MRATENKLRKLNSLKFSIPNSHAMYSAPEYTHTHIYIIHRFYLFFIFQIRSLNYIKIFSARENLIDFFFFLAFEKSVQTVYAENNFRFSVTVVSRTRDTYYIPGSFAVIFVYDN